MPIDNGDLLQTNHTSTGGKLKKEKKTHKVSRRYVKIFEGHAMQNLYGGVGTVLETH